MEPRGCIGEYSRADDAYTLYTARRIRTARGSMLAGAVFHLPETKFRVVANDVGGGFGMKGGVYPEEALVRGRRAKLGRPVKWIPSALRSASSPTTHGRDQVIEAEMALDADGKILGRARAPRSHNSAPTSRARRACRCCRSLRMMPAVYDVPAVHLASRAIFTNTTPTGPYRGAGRPEATYVIERLIDQAAQGVGHRSASSCAGATTSRPTQCPYMTPTGFTYDSGEFAKTDRQGARARRLEGLRRARRGEQEGRQAARPRPRSTISRMPASSTTAWRCASIRAAPCTIVAGTFSHGQGHATTFAQMVSDWLGVPFESIRFVQGDTDQVSFGRGTYGSRSAVVGTARCAARATW